MFIKNKKFLIFTSLIFSLFLITGCQVKIDKDAKPGLHIYKVDNEDNDSGDDK